MINSTCFPPYFSNSESASSYPITILETDFHYLLLYVVSVIASNLKVELVEITYQIVGGGGVDVETLGLAKRSQLAPKYLTQQKQVVIFLLDLYAHYINDTVQPCWRKSGPEKTISDRPGQTWSHRYCIIHSIHIDPKQRSMIQPCWRKSGPEKIISDRPGQNWNHRHNIQYIDPIQRWRCCGSLAAP
jgi:hypothetical protein